MKQYSDTISVELTFSDIASTVVGLIIHTERLIAVNGPAVLVEEYVQILNKLNTTLRENEFDHYTDEKIQEFETYIANNK